MKMKIKSGRNEKKSRVSFTAVKVLTKLLNRVKSLSNFVW